MLTTITRFIYQPEDSNRVVSVIGGSLDVYIIAPNGTPYLTEQLAAPAAPIEATTKQLVTQGCHIEFRPIGGASYWINR